MRELVQVYGACNWSKIASNLPGRNSKSCRLRWTNQLRDGLKRDPFTSEEDAMLRKVRLMGCALNLWARACDRGDDSAPLGARDAIMPHDADPHRPCLCRALPLCRRTRAWATSGRRLPKTCPAAATMPSRTAGTRSRSRSTARMTTAGAALRGAWRFVGAPACDVAGCAAGAVTVVQQQCF